MILGRVPATGAAGPSIRGRAVTAENGFSPLTSPMTERPIGSRLAPGPLWMLGAVACFAVMVMFVKLLREHGVGTLEVMTWRMAPGVPLVWWLLRRKQISVAPRRPVAIGLRTLFGGLAMGAYFWAVEDLSLFANTALQLTQPVFVALLAPALLGERLGRRSALALGLALAGACLVVFPARPSVAAVAVVAPFLPAAVRLFSSLCSALAHMFIRRATHLRFGIGEPDAPDTVVLHFTTWVALVAGGAGLATGAFRGAPPGLDTATMAGWILGMAGTGVAGQLMLSRAYAQGRAPAVALMGYLALPISVLLDAVVWRMTTPIVPLIGAAIVMAAGLLLLFSDSTPRSTAPPPRRSDPK